MTDDKSRRRWINLGELIAIAALGVSAAGVWIAWKSSSDDSIPRNGCSQPTDFAASCAPDGA